MLKITRILSSALLLSTALVDVAYAAPVAAVFTGIIGSLFGGSSLLAGTGILAGIARLGIGLVAQYAAAKLMGSKQKAQASQLETTYGEDLPRTIILGTVGTAGHRIYRNAYSKGNRRLQDVYLLSHFRINKVRRIMFDGRWVNAEGNQAGEAGFRIPSIGDAQLWIKTHFGLLNQPADEGLIRRANPWHRWSSDHRLAGLGYVVATNQLDREDMPQPWQGYFEVEGAPLYDWRLDSTVGGSGNCRWSDQSTWVFTQNPIVMAYNLERGLFIGNEMIVGKGTHASRLHSKISEWTVAANICDEVMPDGGRRYTAGVIASSGAGVTHDQNMRPLLEACAASWVEDAEGQYPIVGANQAVIDTFTDKDICWGESFRFSRKRTRTQLANTVSATYQDPEKFYQASPIQTRIEQDAVAADRERLSVSLQFTAVTDVRVADRLADIAYRASRYQGNAALVLRPRFLETARPGRWIKWVSKKYKGEFIFQILTRQLGALGANGARNVHLTLQEVGNGIFDKTQFETVPVITAPVGTPDYLSEVENLTLSPLVVVVDGRRFPAIRTQRNQIEDITVTGVEFRYYPVLQPEAVNYQNAAVDMEVFPLTYSVVSSSDYAVETRLITQPYRKVPWSAAKFVKTPDQPNTDVLAELAQIGEDAKGVIADTLALQGMYRDLLERVSLDAATGTGMNVVDRQVYTKQFQTAFAQIVEEKRLRADGDGALAEITTALQVKMEDPETGLPALATGLQQISAQVNDDETGLSALAAAILGVEASVGNVSAGGLISFKAAVPPPAGVLSQINILARATVDDEFIQSGMIIQVYRDGSVIKSRILNLANQFVIWDGNAANLPFVYEAGVLKLAIANIGEITAGLIRSPDNRFRFDIGRGQMEWFD